VVDGPAFTAQQDRQSPVSESLPFPSQLLQTLHIVLVGLAL
jgi:hypothetical protein